MTLCLPFLKLVLTLVKISLTIKKIKKKVNLTKRIRIIRIIIKQKEVNLILVGKLLLMIFNI
jgi:hypothetical protein